MRRKYTGSAHGRPTDIDRKTAQCLPHPVMRSRRVHAAFAQTVAHTSWPMPVAIVRLIGVIVLGLLSSQSLADELPPRLVNTFRPLAAAATIVGSAPRTTTLLPLATVPNVMAQSVQAHGQARLRGQSSGGGPNKSKQTAAPLPLPT